MAKNNYRAHGGMCDSSSISRRGVLGLAAAAAFSPLCSHAEEVDEVPVVGDLDLAVNADAPAESWRFSDGIPVESSEPGDGTSFYAAFEKWGKNESGAWVNSIGDPIPGALTRGVDVSEWQKNIDWAAVKADDISFAIVRAAKWAGTDSKGRPGVDVYWERNAAACERQGIPYGSYIYSYATSVEEARFEAEYLVGLMRGHKPSYPLYIDLEDSRIAGADLCSIAAAFCERVEQLGYKAGIYANLNWWTTKLTDQKLNSWSRWVAQYNITCDYPGSKDMWQATSKGSVAGISGNVDISFAYVDLENPFAGQSTWTRLFGRTHLETMAAVSGAGWSSSQHVVIATNASYHDALAASALAGAYSCPVLITNPGALAGQTADEIRRLGAKSAFIVGGPAAISQRVDREVKAAGCSSVSRVYGANGQGTARAVANEVAKTGLMSKTCIIATSYTFQDALSVSPYAYWSKSPIYLCEPGTNRLSAESIDDLKSKGFTRAVIVGGPVAVSSGVEGQLKGCPAIAEVVRLAGATAYETGTEIARWCMKQGMTAAHVGVATGLEHYDALAGAALCGKLGSPLVVVADYNRSAISDFIAVQKQEIKSAYVFGGPAAVSQDTWEKLLRVSLSR